MWQSLARSRFLRVLLLGGLTLSQATADMLASRYYEDALARYQAGDIAGARVQLLNTLQKDPLQLAARLLLAKVHFAAGDALSAEKELLHAQRMGADTAQLALPLARVRNQLGKYRVNAEQLQPSAYPASIQAELWTELGLARLHSDDLAGADIAFTKALELAPAHPEARLGMARIPLARGDLDQALRATNAVLQQTNDLADAWFVKGSILHARGDFAAAAEAYRTARSLSPQHVKAQLGEATATLDAGEFEHASELFRAFVQAHPDYPEASYLLATSLKKRGRLAEAQAALQRASDIIGAVPPGQLRDNPRYLMLGALIAVENRQHEAAYRYLSLYLEAKPTDVKARKLFGATLIELGKAPEAHRILRSLAIRDEVDLQVLVMLGDVNIQMRDYAEAERYYRQALQQFGSSPALRRKLGFAQFGTGDKDQAIDTLASLVSPGAEDGGQTSVFLAIVYFSQGALDKARTLTEAVVERQPKNLVARNLLGAIAVAQGARRRARTIFEDILRQVPGFRPALFNLVKLERMEGHPDKAQRILDELLNANPDDVRALHESARLMIARGDLRAATRFLERIRKLDAAALVPILELTDAYIQADRAEEAVTTAQRLVRGLPENVLAINALAKAQLANGQGHYAVNTLKRAALNAGYDADLLLPTGRLQIAAGALNDAFWTLSRAVEERPGSVVGRNQLAVVLFHQKKFHAAEKQLDLAREIDPTNPFTLALLGDIQLAQKNPGAAEQLYREALQQQGENDKLAASLYRAMMQAGNTDQALRYLTAWVDEHPQDINTLRLLAERHHQEGAFDPALTAYERLLELTPDDAITHNNLANLLAAFDSERALKSARRAYALSPNHPAVLDTLGWSLIQLGELEEGLHYLRNAVARNGRSAVLRFHLAVALEEYGNPIEARHQLERALQLSEDFPQAAEARRRLARLSHRQ